MINWRLIPEAALPYIYRVIAPGSSALLQNFSHYGLLESVTEHKFLAVINVLSPK